MPQFDDPCDSPEEQSTSRSLLARLQCDDAAAWDRLVNLYAPSVLKWCRHENLHADDASDVFQEVFQTVAAKIATFRKVRAHDTFRGWLRTITRNKAYDHYRKLRRQPRGGGGTTLQKRLAQLPAPVPPEIETPETEDSEIFHRALLQIRGHFHERTWLAFWRTVVDDQSPKDVAEELAMTSGAVRVAKSRVLNRLRTELGDLME